MIRFIWQFSYLEPPCTQMHLDTRPKIISEGNLKSYDNINSLWKHNILQLNLLVSFLTIIYCYRFAYITKKLFSLKTYNN